jgi:hypothetical protein
MKRENFITEHLAMGILDTDKPLVYGVLNTERYDVMGYIFLAGVTSDCLEDVGCFPEDIEKADAMSVGDILYAEWPAEKAVLIVKMKDDRFTEEE